MTKRILVASDLSKASDEALRQAHARAVSTGAELAVCHVLPYLLGVNTLFPQQNAESALRLANLSVGRSVRRRHRSGRRRARDRRLRASMP